MFSVGRREREEKRTKSMIRCQIKQSGAGRGGASGREHQHHRHHHVGDGGAVFETSYASYKMGTPKGMVTGGVIHKSKGTDEVERMKAKGESQTGAIAQGAETPLWTMLPKDLIEKVFAFLPLHSLFQARCVCKCWKSVGFSNNLVKLRAEAPVSPPYFPVFLSKGEDRRWCAYDHVQRKWLYLPPLTFLPKEAKHILAGDGGLLCLSESPSTALNYVCNPVTRSLKRVPSLSQDYEPGITHMVVNGKSQGFKMIVTLTHYLESTHVFESRKNSWQATSCLPPHFLLWGRRSSAYCKGFLYCVALEIGGMNMEGLIAYDVNSGVWTDVHGLPRGMRDDPYVLSCGGRVLVVAAQKNTNGRLTSIRIVEFEPVSKRFLEVTEMPQNVMLDVFKCRGGWKPVAFGDKICVASKKTLSVAVYDMSSTCVRCHTAFLTKIMLLYLRHARNWILVNSGLQVSSFLSGIIFLSNCVLGFMSTDSLSLIAECSLLIYESDCGISILKFNFFCDGLVIELYFQMDNSTELYSIRDLICVICSKFYTSGF
uniref:F-box domain-containing protein n=1 Tax=Physcomitrium patens TaxID=3218 RepID=A0A7I4F9W4_PHYPA